MASCDQNQRLFFKATKPHFFKVVLNDTIRDRKIGIPRKFVRKYGNNLPSSIVLKVPSGENWQIELLKCDGEIWLKDGWQEFVEFYSITLGSFLVFEYDQRNCHFNVVIFDKSTSEIDYPYGVKGDNLEEPNNLEKAEDDVSFRILDEFMPSRKIKEESPLALPKPGRKMKLDNPTTPQTQKKRKLDNPTRKSEAKRGNGGRYSEKQKSKRVVARAHSLTAAEKKVVLHRASTAFKTKNPFFMVVMQPAYLHSGGTGRVCFPASFAKKYFNKKYGKATLKTLCGKTWPIEYHYNVYCRKATARIANGWKAFAQENHLVIGDVCVFELINRIETTLKVVIFRYIKVANSKPSLGKSKQLKHKKSSKALGAIEAANEFNSTNPFFQMTRDHAI